MSLHGASASIAISANVPASFLVNFLIQLASAAELIAITIVILESYFGVWEM